MKYPNENTKKFYYLTSLCNKDLTNPYKDIFKDALSLTKTMDSKPYDEYLDFPEGVKGMIKGMDYKCDDNICIFKSNISKITTLIIPRKQYNDDGTLKNFTTIKEFIDNASHSHQVGFWKRVAEEIKKFLEIHDQVYVYTHGNGVAYFHLRLEKNFQYFENYHEEIKKMPNIMINDSIDNIINIKFNNFIKEKPETNIENIEFYNHFDNSGIKKFALVIEAKKYLSRYNTNIFLDNINKDRNTFDKTKGIIIYNSDNYKNSDSTNQTNIMINVIPNQIEYNETK